LRERIEELKIENEKMNKEVNKGCEEDLLRDF
jgi:hypothetical protein